MASLTAQTTSVEHAGGINEDEKNTNNDNADETMTTSIPQPHPKLERQITLIMPSAANDTLKYNTISLNRDIYMSYIVLLTCGTESETGRTLFWEQMSSRDKIRFLVMMGSCMILQVGTLALLSAELVIYPPWNEDETSHGSNAMIITTKLFALCSCALYIYKEYANFRTLTRFQKSHIVTEFDHSSVYSFIWAPYFWTVCICLSLALCLSVGLISTANSGFEAVLNAVGITFILELDDWMYSLVKSHVFIQDEFFEIKYQRPEKKKKATREAAWEWIAINSFGKCSKYCKRYWTKRYNPNQIIDVSNGCKGFAITVLLCLFAAFIFLGIRYDIDSILWIGIICILLIGTLCLCACLASCWVVIGAQFKMFRERLAFWEHVDDIIDTECKLKIENAVNNEERQQIEQQFVNDCMESAYEMHFSFLNDIEGERDILQRLHRAISKDLEIDTKENELAKSAEDGEQADRTETVQVTVNVDDVNDKNQTVEL